MPGKMLQSNICSNKIYFLFYLCLWLHFVFFVNEFLRSVCHSLWSFHFSLFLAPKSRIYDLCEVILLHIARRKSEGQLNGHPTMCYWNTYFFPQNLQKNWISYIRSEWKKTLACLLRTIHLRRMWKDKKKIQNCTKKLLLKKIMCFTLLLERMSIVFGSNKNIQRSFE